MMWTLIKRCSNNLFQEQIFHMYIYGCLCYGFLTFLRSSICSLLLSFDSSDTLCHGGGGSGDGVGLVEVFQNLKSIRSWERIRRSLKLMDMLLPWLTHQGVCQRAVVTSHWQGSKTEQRSWPAQCCRILLGWARPGIKMSMTNSKLSQKAPLPFWRGAQEVCHRAASRRPPRRRPWWSSSLLLPAQMRSEEDRVKDKMFILPGREDSGRGMFVGHDPLCSHRCPAL